MTKSQMTALPSAFELNSQEKVELKNFDLQRQLLLAHRDKLTLSEEVWMNKVSCRLGFDAHMYSMNFDTGMCNLRPELVKQQTDDTKSPTSPISDQSLADQPRAVLDAMSASVANTEPTLEVPAEQAQ